ncbi:MAG: 4Fe-4S dicluster domain-containing protein [Bacteroidales bacterium]|nr:4Fe-4S dicluster domain-containing protein [Bacteroidales bacterium]
MLKPIKFIPHNACTGCESCCAVCGVNSIEMVRDKRGFRYPMIDTDKCTGCGSCERVCPVLNPVEQDKSIRPAQRFFAARAANREVISSSSSGGIFSVIANFMLENNGAVCGAAFDDKFTVVHQVAENTEDLNPLCSSKYVQSSTHKALKVLRKLTAKSGGILFVGTPCQVAGARKLLGNRNPASVFVEVVCHGVPSPGVFNRYIHELEAAQGSPLQSLNFRDKSHGWKSYRFKATFDNGSEISEDGHRNAYVDGFIDNLYLRKSCTECRFKNFKSGADITIGDFWGVDALHNPMYSDDEGVSLLCVNTPRGQEVFESIKPHLKDITEITFDQAAHKNECLIDSTQANFRTARFYRFLKKHSVAESVKMSKRVTFLDKVRISLKYRLSLLKNEKS